MVGNKKITPVVVDASLVAAFLLREPDGKIFEPILASAAGNECEIYVPALFIYEMLNILTVAERRKRISSSQHDSLLSELGVIPLTVDGKVTASVRSRINDCARKHSLTSYDAAYVELAERIGGNLISLDNDILKLKKTIKWIQ